MNIDEILDTRLLKKHIQDAYVNVRNHPTQPLKVYNYSKQAQYSNIMDDVIEQCRGLIVDDKGKIVARPFRRMYNYGQVELPFGLDDRVEVTDKMDGFACISYLSYEENGNPYTVGWMRFATRGSFESEHAIYMNKLWHRKYEFTISERNMAEYTFMFEGITPSLRIVLDYGDMDDLVLLGAVHIDIGEYVGPLEARDLLDWWGPVTDVFEYSTLKEALEAPVRSNAEGFVVRHNNDMVKIKQEDYVALHRMVSNLTVKNVFIHMRDNSIDEMIEGLPDEFHNFVKGTMLDISSRYNSINAEILTEYNSIPIHHRTGERKAFATYALDKRHTSAMFSLYDHRGVRDYIWKQVERELKDD